MTFKPNIGDVFLNKYEIVSLVGEGAFGCVYRAKDTKLDRIVAVKFINTGGNTIERFMDELDAIKNLDHPNIVRLYDYDILRGGTPCIVMEFVNGREIGDILSQDGPFEPLRICEIAQQVLDALVETHRHGIIHCDLKPENIMLTSVGARSDVVKLIDFGVASILSKTSSAEERQKFLVGTPQYMAPEQIVRSEIGPWTDIYALGLILIELFTGQFVFDDDDPREVLKMQLHKPVEIPHQLACIELGPIISRATQKDVSKRYQSTQQFYDEICDAMQTIQTSARLQPMRKHLDTSHGRSRLHSSILDDLSDFGIAPTLTRASLSSGTHAAQADDDGTTRFASVALGSRDIPDRDEAPDKFRVPLITNKSLAGAMPSFGEDDEAENFSPPLLKLEKPSAPAMPPANPLPADLTSLKNSLGELGLDTPPETPAKPEPPASHVSAPETAPIPRIQQKIEVKDADLSPEAAVPKSRVMLATPVAKKPPVIKLAVAVLIAMLIAGGSYYCWKTGLLDRAFRKLGIDSPIPKDRPAEAAPAEPPVPEKKNVVRFSTLQSASVTMAYSAAISGHYGAFETPRRYNTYRVIGTPTNAAIFVNNAQVCAKTPCMVNIFGDPSRARLEIRANGKSGTADLSTHDPKSPVIVVSGN